MMILLQPPLPSGKKLVMQRAQVPACYISQFLIEEVERAGFGVGCVWVFCVFRVFYVFRVF